MAIRFVGRFEEIFGGKKDMEELQTMRTRILEVVEAGKKRGLLRLEQNFFRVAGEIGRASCRERVFRTV